MIAGVLFLFYLFFNALKKVGSCILCCAGDERKCL
jgi:hypothetical protein